MIPLRFLGVLPLLSLYVGVLLCTGASLACPHPPCRESLVAAPIQSISGAGTGARACEGHTGPTSCGMGVALLAISDVPRRVEHRHSLPQAQPKVGETAATYVLEFSVTLKVYYVKKKRKDISKTSVGLSIELMLLPLGSCSKPAATFVATCNQIFHSLDSEILIDRKSESCVLSSLGSCLVSTLNTAPPKSHEAMTAIKGGINLELLLKCPHHMVVLR